MAADAALLRIFGGLKEALEKYDAALSLNPGEVSAWQGKAITLISLQKYGGAVEYFDKVLEKNPTDRDSLYWKGYALFELGKYTDALAYVEKTTELYPKYADAWVVKGMTHIRLKEFEHAEKSFEKVISLDPKDERGWFGKGDVQFRLGNEERALEYFEKAVKMSPYYVPAWQNKGRIYLKQEKFKEAAQCFWECANIDKTDKLSKALFWYCEGGNQYKLKNEKKAREFFNKAVSLWPELKSGWYSIKAEPSGAQPSSDAEKWFYQGKLFANTNKADSYEKAFDCFIKALEIDEKFAEAWYELAIMCGKIKKENTEKYAPECFKRALKLDKNFLDAWCGKADAHIRLGENDEALTCIEKAIEVAKKSGVNQEFLKKLEQQKKQIKDNLI